MVVSFLSFGLVLSIAVVVFLLRSKKREKRETIADDIVA